MAVLVDLGDGEELWLPRSQFVGKQPRKGKGKAARGYYITNWLAAREWPFLFEDDWAKPGEFDTAQPDSSWWAVLGCERDDPADFVETRYLKLVRLHHPDRGGDVVEMQKVNEAYERFRGERNL